MRKKLFAPLLGAVVLGISAYAGYRTYDAYADVNESDLLLANAEALADGEGGYGTTGVADGDVCWILLDGKQKQGRKITCYDSQTSSYCTPDICSVTSD